MGENSPEKEENEFESKVEELAPTEEVYFEPTPGFGQWAKFFPEAAKTHPAKANLNLINFLILEYTKPGDVILDPMAGTYSTCVLAVLNGRHGIGVELEEKFYEWGLEAKKIVESSPTVVPKGKMVVLQGDARKLSEILKQVDFDAIITSPPYAGTSGGKGEKSREPINEKYPGLFDRCIGGNKGAIGSSLDNIDNLPMGEVDTVITSPPYLNDNVKKNSEEFWKRAKEEGKRWGSKPPSGTEDKLMENEENIANLPLGEVDTVITSPPYANINPTTFTNGSISGKEGNFKDTREKLVKQEGYSETPENIGNLPLGNVDTIITSPPYSEGIGHDSGDNASKGYMERLEMQWKYTRLMASEGNIAQLRHGNVDAIITSPPYGDTYLGGGNPEKRIERLLQEGYNPKDFVRGTSANALLEHYSEKRENIGNLPYVDVIISSPPYANISKPENIKKPITKEEYESRKLKGDHSVYHDTRPERKGTLYEYYEMVSIDKYGGKENIDYLPFGNIDTIITSPPYADTIKGSGRTREEALKRMIEQGKDQRLKTFLGEANCLKWQNEGVSRNPDNIANLSFVDTIITSPPYEASLEGTSRHTRGGIASRDPALAQTGSYATVMSFGVPVGYSPNPDNIGNLKSSDEEYKMLVDGIITSPPYANTSLQDYGTSNKALLELEAEVRKSFKEKGYFEYNGKRYTEKEWREINKGELKPRGIPELWAKILKSRQDSGYNTANPENIGNLPISDEEYKILIDSIITSPPYAHESTASEPTKLEKEGKFKMGHSKETPYTEENYREWSKHVGGNIGKKKMMVRVPCSPEEADFHDTRPERKGTVWEWTKEVEATPETVEQIQKQKEEKKGKSETYLEAMLKVYSECHKVLKHGGRAIIIVKPFVRGKRPIDLPYHTWLLMEKVGFKLEKVYKLRLQTKSFWRILYEKRHPEVPKIRHEWIIVARKE